METRDWEGEKEGESLSLSFVLKSKQVVTHVVARLGRCDIVHLTITEGSKSLGVSGEKSDGMREMGDERG